MGLSEAAPEVAPGVAQESDKELTSRGPHASDSKPWLWKPGQSGNPAGRQKQPKFETVIRRELEKLVPGCEHSKQEKIAELFVQQCLDKDNFALRELLARVWPVTAKLEVSGGEEPIKIQVAPTDGDLGEILDIERELSVVNE